MTRKLPNGLKIFLKTAAEDTKCLPPFFTVIMTDGFGQSDISLLSCGIKHFFDIVPVYDFFNRVEIVGAAVLAVKVV